MPLSPHSLTHAVHVRLRLSGHQPISRSTFPASPVLPAQARLHITAQPALLGDTEYAPRPLVPSHSEQGPSADYAVTGEIVSLDVRMLFTTLFPARPPIQLSASAGVRYAAPGDILKHTVTTHPAEPTTPQATADNRVCKGVTGSMQWMGANVAPGADGQGARLTDGMLHWLEAGDRARQQLLQLSTHVPMWPLQKLPPATLAMLVDKLGRPPQANPASDGTSLMAYGKPLEVNLAVQDTAAPPDSGDGGPARDKEQAEVPGYGAGEAGARAIAVAHREIGSWASSWSVCPGPSWCIVSGTNTDEEGGGQSSAELAIVNPLPVRASIHPTGLTTHVLAGMNPSRNDLDDIFLAIG